MPKKKPAGPVHALRRQAEESMSDNADSMPEIREALSPEEVQHLFHELRVHQIELEIQNEELRQSQAELAALHFRYFDLFDQAPVGYFTLSEQGLILEANLKTAALVGVQGGGLVGQPLTRFIFSEDQDIFYHLRNLLIETGEPQICELRLRKKGAAQFWVRLEAAMKDADGNPVIHIVMSDITDFKRTEEALRKSEVHLQTLVQTIPDLIWLKDPDGVYLDCNVQFERFFGAVKMDIRGKTDYDFVDRELADFFREHDRKAMAAGMSSRNEEWLTFADDGHRALFETIKTPMLDAEGNLSGVLGIARDITERKRAEKLLRKSEQDLRKKNEELTRFNYSVSHDLKSPLITIETFLDYLEQDMDSKNAERIEKDVTHIRAAAGKMASLLDELFQLSRIGRVVSDAVTSPLQSIVEEALNLVAGQITRRGVKVEVTAEPVDVTGEHRRLVEVFQNLVDNAVKFMGDQPAPKIEIGMTIEGDEIVFFVHDNGIGIDPKHRHKLFGLFEKLDPETKGSGLGLALVKRIVENHGGRIWAASEGLGRGSMFCFTLQKPNDP